MFLLDKNIYLFICHKFFNEAFVDNGFNIVKLKKFLDKTKMQ